MVSPGLRSFALMAFVTAVLFMPTGASPHHKRTTNLDNVSPLSQAGYTVPLKAAWTCQNQSHCSDELPAPGYGMVLQTLAIARGSMIYSCGGTDQTNEPAYISQDTELYDIAALIPYFPTEDTLHELVPELYQYDYSGHNNSLNCIGTINTQYGKTTVNLQGHDSFGMTLVEGLKAPTDATKDGYWVLSISDDKAWEVYRVKMAGGAVPVDCHEHNNTFEIVYAAEYWFYHG